MNDSVSQLRSIKKVKLIIFTQSGCDVLVSFGRYQSQHGGKQIGQLLLHLWLHCNMKQSSIKMLCLAKVVHNSKGSSKLLPCSEQHCLLVGDNFPTRPYPQANETKNCFSCVEENWRKQGIYARQL